MGKPVQRLIVAKYMEDISWINDVPFEVNIIDKGNNDIDNIGREANTYLYYILNNWNNLADYNIFCQGNPFDHCPDFLQNITQKVDYKPLGNFKATSNIHGEPHHKGLYMGYLYKMIMGETMGKTILKFTAGAQFIVSKKIIKKRNLKFYKMLYDYTFQDKDAAYKLERMWNKIFIT